MIKKMYPTVTSARSCNKVGHLLWFTILAQHETNDVILYIHSVHKHRGNSFQRQNYKMRLKQRSLNWINSMQVKKILFTNVFFSWSLCLLNMFPSMAELSKIVGPIGPSDKILTRSDLNYFASDPMSGAIFR